MGLPMPMRTTFPPGLVAKIPVATQAGTPVHSKTRSKPSLAKSSGAGWTAYPVEDAVELDVERASRSKAAELEADAMEALSSAARRARAS